MKEAVAKLGAVTSLGSPDYFATFIAAQYQKWREVAKAANIRID